jgi:hypothetical protein
MAARISRTTYPFWQTAPKIRLMTTSRLFLAAPSARVPGAAQPCPDVAA